MSEFNKLKNKGLGRGRPRLSDKERANRKELVTIRQEAHRRAKIVLVHRHTEEYNKIFALELKSLSR
jgi:hypothetical protein